MKQLEQPLKQRLRKQRGAITLLGVASIAVSLFAFNQVMEFGNAKLLDRKLDNYARTVASVALRSELAITKKAIDEGAIPANQTSLVVDDLLTQVGMYVQDTNDVTHNLEKKIIFGNFADESICNSSDEEIRKNCFIPLESGEFNPKAEDPVPDFSAVAVKLTSSESFLGGVYTPEGKALYGLDADNVDNQDCYCKNRYESCRGADLSDVAWAGEPYSDSRDNYCNYGYTDSKISNADETKYPLATFDDAWIGRAPDTVNFFMFYTQGYDDASFARVLGHKPLLIADGKDPLYEEGGMFSAMEGMMSMMCPCMGSTDEKLAYEQTLSSGWFSSGSFRDYNKSDIVPSANTNDYRCLDSGMFVSAVRSCSDSSWGSSNWPVVLNDSFYIGYQGTCVPGTDSGNLAMSRCLAYEENGVSRYQSCLDIERNSSMQMNFFERMMAFFFGPVLNWERSYEGLNCEMKKMRYKGWMFWGGWQDV
ncbi:MAG: hypothetical protein R3189_03255 [Thiomicrorhabdus chilensis]|uniref:hypothetical protein n=1 Tax=Thiomicrorhabdus chilensis TaxID=63656 RepID=UPI00299E9C8F|nr:hypothetical protein [Thiomicrorhabdus chilensis]MDX1347252.1 hypothetical protein [Thiomicrorhabdus chilensis]